MIMEAALTTISTSRTPSPPSMPTTRSLAYRNWLGLMKGDAGAELRQGRQDAEARGSIPTASTRPDGKSLTLPGRSLMLMRNVGHH
jgi:malate synthase